MHPTILRHYEHLLNIGDDGIISLDLLRRLSDSKIVLGKQTVRTAGAPHATVFLANESTVLTGSAFTSTLQPEKLHQWDDAVVCEFVNRDVQPFPVVAPVQNQPLEWFISTALQLTGLVIRLHDSGLIHRNLSPAAFLKDRATDALYLTDFYVAKPVAGSVEPETIPKYYPAAVRYIAPEQTGHIDLTTDERTDLYALGAIFYEMLCGEPPFTDSETSALLYSHVTREPVPVGARNRNVPQPVSSIIAKLLRKNPAHRYNSGRGLLADLEECGRNLREGNDKFFFNPGANDRTVRLQPLDKIYGRTGPLNELHEAFLRAENGCGACVFISGQAGVGKSYLVEMFRKSIERPAVYFACGKCEASSTSVPYHALSGAIVDLIRTIVAQGNESVQRWKDILLDTIGDQREIIAELIPEVQMIIGPCRHRTIPAEAEAATQFKNVFIKFLRSFIRKESVFVLFIDDLQWADSALSSLLAPAFFESVECGFLFIGAGRNRFDSDDPLVRSVAASSVPVSTINLTSLAAENTRRMIADALGSGDEDITELEAIISRKTGGNPLFLKEFLEMLISRRLLYRRFIPAGDGAPSAGRWTWERDKIAQLCCTENVVEIIIDKAAMLPDDTQRLLAIASCIGREFNASVVAAVENVLPEQANASLQCAVETGILRGGLTGYDHTPSGDCQFSHDRIHEAIYNRILPDERTRYHLAIGRHLLHLSKTGDAVVSIYDIVRHFNVCRNAITDGAERFELAALNREAARRSRNANACAIALECLNAALGFLPPSAWSVNHELMFDIELSRAECEALLANMEGALGLLRTLGSHQLTPEQYCAVDLVAMTIHDHRQNTGQSMAIGFARLKQLGERLPEHPSIPYLLLNVGKAALAMRGIVTSRKTAPTTGTVPEIRMYIFRIVSRLWLHAFNLQKQKVVMAIVAHLINGTRAYGQCGAASVAICFWGILVGTITRNPKRGLRYGALALSIAKRYDDLFSRGITCFLYGSFFAHCDGHLDGTLDLFAEGRRCSYEAGDIVSTSNSIEGQLLIKALAGKTIVEVRQSAHEAIRFLELIGIPVKGQTVVKFINDWAGQMESGTYTAIHDVVRNADGEVPLVKGIFLLFALLNAVIDGDHAGALHITGAMKGNALLDPTSYFYSLFIFLKALAISGDESVPVRRRASAVKKNLAILRRSARWSEANLRHLFLLVRAEHHRLENRRWEALIDYRNAVETARRQRFVHHAALAAERAASFMKPYDIEESRSFTRTAMSLYAEWGAHGKVAVLRREAPEVTFLPASRNPLYTGITDTDFQALLKSFEAISTELLIDRLTEKLIRIVMQNTGAVRGVLLIEEHGIFFARVEGVLRFFSTGPDSGIESRTINIPAEDFTVPQGILSYVQRTREPVRLENASVRDRFVNDPYIKNQAVRSVLCVPLVGNDAVRGIIYLENNMLEAAFPAERLQFIRLLCGQAIIAIENALFHDLEIKHLQSKVNPHFIFNALSSIAELCHSDPDATEDAIIKLSTLYRYVLTAEMRLVTLDEELEIVHKYLAIEKLRFGNRLSYEVRISGDPKRVRMPSMLIQPLVENSIKHGISPRPSGGAIAIVIAITGSRCEIIVEDNGMGPNVSTAGTGYGLSSIKKRLVVQFNNEATFETDDAKGFKVRFSFPVIGTEPESARHSPAGSNTGTR